MTETSNASALCERKKKINTLFAGLGRSVLGKNVPLVWMRMRMSFRVTDCYRKYIYGLKQKSVRVMMSDRSYTNYNVRRREIKNRTTCMQYTILHVFLRSTWLAASIAGACSQRAKTVRQNAGHTPSKTKSCTSWFTASTFDIEHPRYGQLTPLKTRYPLTNTT